MEINGWKLIDEICSEVRVCGAIMTNAVRDRKYVTNKEGHANFVTVYDTQIQEHLKKELLRILPEAVFVGEEEEVHAQIAKGFSFIVDPIDGTTNFVRDFHFSAVSVGLLLDAEPYIGVIYNPYIDEMYTAWKGHGAYLNGKPIHVSDRQLSEGLVLFGTAAYYQEYTKQTFDKAYEYFMKSGDVRRCGTATLDLCMIAAGRAELFFEYGLQPWDYAAGALIVTEAGGVITTMDHEPLPFDRRSTVLACAPQCDV